MPGITATIITLNEESRIAAALSSLACCDEILIVDSGSTDRTREVASRMGAQVISHPWEGYSLQKNFAAERAANDWILSIDADERLSIELANEIVQWKKATSAAASPKDWAVACSMPRRAFYLGKWINHSGWYPDRKVRLYDRRYCRWEGSIHESLKIDGRVDRFKGDLLHFPFDDWTDQQAKIDRYTELAARAAHERGDRGSILSVVFSPPLTFIKSYFLRAGFLDGCRGFAIAYSAARYAFLRHVRILRSWN
jgi:glycosyltransferase involved in cell wall biosynthesis